MACDDVILARDGARGALMCADEMDRVGVDALDVAWREWHRESWLVG